MKIDINETCNKVVDFYQNDGLTFKQALYRGVGEQARNLEKEMYWNQVREAVEDYCRDVDCKLVDAYLYKKSFDDGNVLDFILKLTKNVEQLAQKSHSEYSTLQVDALILSRLLRFILEVK